MRVKYHKSFVKNYNKRFGGNKKIKEQYKKRLQLFIKDPQNPILKNHRLIGRKLSLRTFSVTGDVRVIYYQKGNTAYFLDIGTHSQVY